ncbi:MAG: hypothetical protein QHI48_01960 [Bacteroidota bacterium]|nr:hypothetical protein [Bacteroidota bacterium]
MVPTRVLLILIDGAGIGPADPARNPFFRARLASLREILGGEFPSLRKRRVSGPFASCIPANAALGVPGLPQSGTGQSALYTGINTARLLGKHFGPYLPSDLKPVVAECNLFARALRAGIPRRCITLANAFPRRFFEYLESGARRFAAGMFAARSSGIPFRDASLLRQRQAVSTDITGTRWKELGHPDIPVVSPREAGYVLASLANAHRLTLFEFFQTDTAGHRRAMDAAVRLLEDVDEFLGGVFDRLHRSSIFGIVCGDHGNIEDLSTKSHTRNPAFVLLFGRGHAEAAGRIASLTDIMPVVMGILERT